MPADGPTTIRLGFGVKAALEAKVPIVPVRSRARVNLDQVLDAYPHLRSSAEAALERGVNADSLLDEIREKGLAERYWLGGYDREGELKQSRYSDDLGSLEVELEQATRLRLWKSGEIQEFRGGQWSVIRMVKR